MQHILLVEDDAAFRYAAARQLLEAGFGVREAADYRGALEILQSDVGLDLMITDIVMPEGINGFALARMAMMRRPELKLIYLTAFDLPTAQADAPVLRKPITGDKLIDAVRSLLPEPEMGKPA